jgi:hypothetical protein
MSLNTDKRDRLGEDKLSASTHEISFIPGAISYERSVFSPLLHRSSKYHEVDYSMEPPWLLYVLFLSHTGSDINRKGKIDRKGSHGSTNRLCIDATYYSPLAVLGVSSLRQQTLYPLKSFHQQSLLQTDR